MRPKFVLGLCLFAFLVLGAAVFLKQHLGGGTTPSANAGSVASVPPVRSNAVATVAPPLEPAPALLPVAPPPSNIVASVTNAASPEPVAATPGPSQDAIDAEVDRLQDWSMNNDPASLSNILADLTNSVKEIREAAIDAAKDFGSAKAIPALKAAAEITDDLQEKIDYLEAAQFLSVPPLDFNGPVVPPSPAQVQLYEQRRTERAKQQAQIRLLQQQLHNQGPQTPSDQNPPPAPNNQ